MKNFLARITIITVLAVLFSTSKSSQVQGQIYRPTSPVPLAPAVSTLRRRSSSMSHVRPPQRQTSRPRTSGIFGYKDYTSSRCCWNRCYPRYDPLWPYYERSNYYVFMYGVGYPNYYQNYAGINYYPLLRNDDLDLQARLNAKIQKMAASQKKVQQVAAKRNRFQSEAERNLELGNSNFAKGKYAKARKRYLEAFKKTKKEISLDNPLAVHFSPKLADIWFRLGFVEIALGDYHEACELFENGLNLNSDFQSQNKLLTKLYNFDQAHIDKHQSAMAKYLLLHRKDADATFALAVHLYFSGEAARAETFFEKTKNQFAQYAGASKIFLASINPN